MSEFSGEDIACRRGERLIFRGLNFSVGAGEALVLLGPNGSGKTSLLRIMAGFLTPVEGCVLRNGLPVRDDPARHKTNLHYVDYRDGVKPALSVMENLSFFAALRGGADKDTLHGALVHFGLDKLADDPARMLSLGQSRRLSLARLLVTQADLWLLDEPITALDLETAHRLEEVIADHRRRGGIVVVATHAEMRIGRAMPLYLDRYAPGAHAPFSGQLTKEQALTEQNSMEQHPREQYQ